MKPIVSLAEISEGLEHLAKADPRLVPVIEAAGEVPLRRRAADFAGLVNIVVAQQVSVASANAIYARVETLVQPFEAKTLAGITDEELGKAGLSRPKIRTVRAIAGAVVGGLDLAHLAERPAEEAHEALCKIKGVGRWTSDIYLLFCAGHPDVFPSGDLALQNAVRDAFGLGERPKPDALDEIANPWAPWRGVAARLFWAYYKAVKEGRETLPV